ncbi:hypothetical protein BKA56DRAFT_616428 [Ilyonectria sp. MPI-CAGE-AT-0026]|nr:hypothetical protein BKA56DRAFT_616428 [Ilyonectria sp. MPI-CAGE-AT-0026]
MRLLTCLLLLCSLLLQHTLAADCFGIKGVVNGDNEWRLWDLRQRMCARLQTRASLYVAYGVNAGFSLERYNSGGKKGFPNCWAATENIINQCARGSGKQASGNWNYGGENYQYNAWAS